MYDIYKNVEYIYIQMVKLYYYYTRNIDKHEYRNRMFQKSSHCNI